MFADAPVKELQPVYCVGVIDEVKELKLTSSGAYVMLPFTIRPLASGIKTRGQFIFHPLWLRPGFDPSEEFDTETKEGKSALFMYQKNIKPEKARKGDRQAIGILAGLAGSQERFNQIASKLLAVKTAPDADGYSDEIEKILTDFLFPNKTSAVDAEGQPIALGYRMVQNREKNEETGKYEIRPGYQLGEFFYADNEVLDKLREDAEAKKSFRVTF